MTTFTYKYPSGTYTSTFFRVDSCKSSIPERNRKIVEKTDFLIGVVELLESTFGLLFFRKNIYAESGLRN